MRPIKMLACGSLNRGSATSFAESAAGASDVDRWIARGIILGIQPTASLLKTRFRGAGAGGSRCMLGRIAMVKRLQPISRTTIAVVTYIIRSASSDDS